MEHLSLKEKAYHIIKEKLLKMEFEPGGRIREDLLAEEISMSRTPVREAINKLTAEGFINYVPRRGLFFIEIKKEEIRDLLDVREALEILAVNKCIEKISVEKIKCLGQILDDCERVLKAGQYTRCNDLDSQFHQEIAKVSGNKKLIEFCHEIENYMQIARAVEKETQTREKIKCALAEHRTILKCIKKKDKHGAEVSMRTNILSMKRNLGI
jgi:DNA-binding GntR family transcriptional regulator